MATEDKQIQRIIDIVGSITAGQICIEPSDDADIGGKRLGWKDAGGTTHKALAKDEDARVTTLEATVDVDWPDKANLFDKTSDDSDDLTEGSTKLLMTTTERTNLADAYLKSTDNLDDTSDGTSRAAYLKAPTSGQTAIGISQTLITDSTDEYSVKNKVATVLKSGETVSDEKINEDSRIVIDDDFCYTITVDVATGAIYTLQKFDRRTGDLLQSLPSVLTGARALVRTPTKVVFVATTCYEFNPNDITDYATATATGSPGGVKAAFYRRTDGKIYEIGATGSAYGSLLRGATSYTYTSIRALSEVVNYPRAACADMSDDYFYLADFSSSATGYIRKFDIATGVQSYASSGISSGASSYVSVICFIDRQGRSIVALRATNITYFYHDTGSALTKICESIDDIGSVTAALYAGFIYSVGLSASDSKLDILQLPALTDTEPDFVNSIGGSGAYAADGVRNSDDSLYTVSKDEMVSSVKAYIERRWQTVDIAGDPSTSYTLSTNDENSILLFDHSCEFGYGHALLIPAEILAIQDFRFAIQTEGSFAGYINIYPEDDYGSATAWLKCTADSTGAFARIFNFRISNGQILCDSANISEETTP